MWTPKKSLLLGVVENLLFCVALLIALPLVFSVVEEAINAQSQEIRWIKIAAILMMVTSRILAMFNGTEKTGGAIVKCLAFAAFVWAQHGILQMNYGLALNGIVAPY